MKKITLYLVCCICLSFFTVQTIYGSNFDHEMFENFAEALMKNNNNKAISIIEKDDPNSMDNHKRTLLMATSFIGNFEVSKFLLNNGANPNMTDADGMTSLMYASREGRVEIVKLLLNYGADKNIEMQIQEDWKAKAIDYARSYDYPEIVEILQSNKTDFGMKNNNSNLELNDEYFKEYFENKSKNDLDNNQNNNFANNQRNGMGKNDKDFIIEIVYEESDQQVKNPNKNYSQTGNKAFIVEIDGQPIRTRFNQYQITPKKAPPPDKDFMPDRNFIADNKFNDNQGNNQTNNDTSDKTALMKAASEGKFELAKILVENGADIEAKDEGKNSALSLATKNNHQEIIDLLENHSRCKKCKALPT